MAANNKNKTQSEPTAVKQLSIGKTIIKNLVMGGTAGLVGAVSCYPLDMAKTRLQNQKIIAGQEPMYKGVLDTFTKILARDGIRGLYRGLPAQLVGIVPEKAIKLTVNDTIRYTLTDKKTGELKVIHEMIAGGIAGLSQVVVTNPYELVKVRLQTETAVGADRKGLVSVVKEIGAKGMFRGAGACLLRDVPFSAIYFTLYGNLKKVFTDKNGNLPLSRMFLAGILAGVFSAGTVTPADVVKTRLQVKSSPDSTSPKYNGIIDCFSKIIKEEGAAALFKGTVPRILIISPLFGITLGTYELLKDYFA